MSGTAPDLAVLLPVYDAMEFLPATIRSLQVQTMADFDVIAVDDESSDGSGDYLRSLGDERIRVFRQANTGTGGAVNRALGECRSPYFARLDADDIALPDRFARQLDVLRTEPDLALLGTQIEFVIGERTLAAPPVPTAHDAIRRRLLRGEPVLCHSSVAGPAEAFRRAGGVRISGFGEDLDFFLRMSAVGRLHNLSDVLLRYRIHLDSVVTRNHDENVRGIRYAIECARCRQRGEREPVFAEFADRWSRRGWLRRAMCRLDGHGRSLYRRALIDRSEGRRAAAALRLAAATMCRPRAAARNVGRRLLG